MAEEISPVTASGWIEALKDVALQVGVLLNFTIDVKTKNGFTEALVDFSTKFNIRTKANIFPDTSAGCLESLEDLCNQVNTWLVANSYEVVRLSLFDNNEVGVLYDNNDFSTLFQDSAGTIPVTAPGQPVGLQLDKSKGLVRGPELVSNGTFDGGSVGWTLGNGWTISGGRAVHSSVAGAGFLTLNTSLVAGKWYEVTYDTNGGGNSMNFVFAGTFIAAPTSTGRKKVIGLAGSTPGTTGFQGGGDYSLDNISIKEIPGNHRYQTTAASRPLLQKNATTGAHYLLYDGVDDFLVTNSVDFTSTDKVSVFAGIRKLSDSAVGAVCELSADINSNNGAFALFAPISTASNTLNFQTKGTLARGLTANGYPAPISAVLSGVGDITGDISILRVNSSEAGRNTGDQGAGNFGNYPLYFGRRAGTSLPFNGHEYSMIIRGALTSQQDTEKVEGIIAGDVGVTLSV